MPRRSRARQARSLSNAFESLEPRRFLSADLFPVRQYNLPVIPFEVVATDLNGDGRPDVVAEGGGTTNGLAFLLNAGDGRLNAPVAFDSTVTAHGLVAADFSGDGKPDVAFGNNANVLVNTNQGNGTLSSTVSYAMGVTVNDLAAGDVNGDGRPDLIAVATAGNVVVRLNTGGGTFAAATTYPVVSGSAAVILADVNGDGHPDVVTANGNGNSVSVLLNSGAGTFGAAATYAVGSNPVAITAADVNHDGHLDLLTANQNSNNVSLLYNTGSGAFAGAISLTAPTAPTQISVADLNHDGNPDVITSSASGVIGVRLNTGTSLGALVTYSTLSSVRGFMTTADFDGDGNPDVALSSDGRLSVIFGAGDGTLLTGRPLTTPGDANHVAHGDFNQDGKDDLVTVNGSSSVSVFLRTASATFAPAVTYALPFPNVSALTVGDFNGDGWPDLALVGAFPTKAAILLNKKDGTFNAAVAYTFTASPTAAAAGDLNGDGHDDLAVVFSTGVGVMLSGANGTLAAPVMYAAGTTPLMVAIGDVNHDGKLDLALPSKQDSAVAVLLNAGSGTFGAATSYSVAVPPSLAAIVDLNGDSLGDLVAASSTNTFVGTVSVLLNTGSFFNAAVQYGVDGIVNHLVVGDVNADGTPDLAMTLYREGGPGGVSGGYALITDNADGTLNAPRYYGIGDSNPVDLTFGNFGGDARLDLAVTDVSPLVSVLLNQSGDTAAPAVTTAGYDASGAAPKLSIAFGEALTPVLTPANFTVTNLSTSTTVPSANLAVAWDAASKTETLTFPGYAGGQLPDGNYSITIPPGAVTDASGNVSTTALVFILPIASGDRATYLAADADGIHTDVWVGSATPGTGTPSFQYVTDQLSSLNVLGGVAAVALTLDFTHGDAFPVGGVRFNGGGATALNFVGTIGDDTVTVGPAGVTFANGALGSIPVFAPNLQTVALRGGGGGNDSVHFTGGAYTLDADTATGTPNVSLLVSTGASVSLASTQHLAGLAIAGGSLSITSASVTTLNLTAALSVTGGGSLNLGHGQLLLNSATTALALVRSYLLLAYDNGAWDGVGGITSSLAAGDPAHTSIAYLSGANAANAALDSRLSDPAAILLRPSLIGDFNIDGKVDRFDIRAFNARNAFNDGLTTHDWSDGDLTFDGKIDRFDIRAFNAGNNFNSGVTLAEPTFTVSPAAAIPPLPPRRNSVLDTGDAV